MASPNSLHKPQTTGRKKHRCSSLCIDTDHGEIDDDKHDKTQAYGTIQKETLEESPSVTNSGGIPKTCADQVIAHCHSSSGLNKIGENGIDKKARRKLIIASLLVLFFTVAEIVGGYFANSLAIMTDAAHMFTDFISFMISLLAVYLAGKAPTKKMNFGWNRAEVVGAVVSILMIWLMTGVLVYLAINRIIKKEYEIEATVMLITAAIGVFINLVLGITLHHGHNHTHTHNTNMETEMSSDDSEDLESSSLVPKTESHRPNMNVRAAFIHVLGDLIQSIGVLVAAFIIYYKPEWKIVDPICTFIFSVLVLFTTLTIMRDALNVLMEGTPRGMKYSDVKRCFLEVEGVKDVHGLRLWSLTMTRTALSVHIAIDTSVSDYPDVLRAASFLVQSRFGIQETTIQLEEYVDDMIHCVECQDPLD